MPQGAMKKKSSKPFQNAKVSKRASNKNLKKGGKAIAPKKTKLVEALKMQKAFTKCLKEQLEGELSVKAAHVESKSFKVIQNKNSKGSTSKEKPAT